MNALPEQVAEPGVSLQSALERQKEWSATANRLKARLNLWRNASLALVTTGATLGVASSSFRDAGLPGATVIGSVGVVALAISLFVRSRRIGRDSIRDWTRARSASEAIKKEIYTYLTKSGAYATEERGEVLNTAVDSILDSVHDLAKLAFLSPGDPPEPRRFLTVDEYIEERVERQSEGYYRRRAKELSQELDRFRRLEFVLTGAATALGAVAVYVEASVLGAWIPVLTTASGAILTHIEAARFERQILSYSVTARRLESLRNSWKERREKAPPLPEESTEFVAACEDAISVENEGWMAEWTSTHPGSGRSTAKPETRPLEQPRSTPERDSRRPYG